jgi:hypothetical protein
MRLDLAKAANWANILALLPGCYCAWGTYQLLHPFTAATPVASPDHGTAMVSPKLELISLAIACGLVLLASVLNIIAAWKRRSATQSSLQTTTGAIVSSSPPAVALNLNAVFQQGYTSALQEETEANVRTAVNTSNPPNRDAFYVKLIAWGLIAFTYEIIWSNIYKSQLLLLHKLNSKMLSLAEAKGYYDKAVAENPNSVYQHYTFDQWLAFLKANILIIIHPNGMIEGTKRMRDFLKYLVHWGHAVDDKKL